MKPSDLLSLLTDVYREKYALRASHAAAARLVSDYEFNNAYQYVIAREDVHLAWLRAAIEQMEGQLPDPPPEPEAEAPGRGEARLSGILGADRDAARAFVDRWRERIERVTNARQKGMLRVIIGETLEQARFFDQALAGRRDLLGRRADGAGTGGGVLSTRWVG